MLRYLYLVEKGVLYGFEKTDEAIEFASCVFKDCSKGPSEEYDFYYSRNGRDARWDSSLSCYHPIQAWRDGSKTKNGKRGIVFKRSRGIPGSELSLPCGQCIDCRLERSRQWAVRCLYESRLYEDNCFITLTYSSQFLPVNQSLDVREFQLFMKRFRKLIASEEFIDKYNLSSTRIRFFHCGEYGEVCGVCNKSRPICGCSVFTPSLGRPHYHACVFGFDFPDKVYFPRKGENGFKVFTSEILKSLWPYGFSTCGEVTFESAAYVARYIVKKVTGKKAKDWYKGRKPEYVTMSRRPGLGKGWFDKYKKDVYPSDEVIIKGHSVKPPKFFDGLLEKEDKSLYEKVKFNRVPKGEKKRLQNDSFARKWKEVIKKNRLSLLGRKMEEENG